MDPKPTANLDPRPEGISNPTMGGSPTAIPMPAPSEPPTTEPQQPPMGIQEPQPQVVAQAEIPSPVLSPQPQTAPIAPAQTTSSTTEPLKNAEKKRGWGWILIAAGIVISILAYAIFWLKVFNLKLPFLS